MHWDLTGRKLLFVCFNSFSLDFILVSKCFWGAVAVADCSGWPERLHCILTEVTHPPPCLPIPMLETKPRLYTSWPSSLPPSYYPSPHLFPLIKQTRLKTRGQDPRSHPWTTVLTITSCPSIRDPPPGDIPVGALQWPSSYADHGHRMEKERKTLAGHSKLQIKSGSVQYSPTTPCPTPTPTPSPSHSLVFCLDPDTSRR